MCTGRDAISLRLGEQYIGAFGNLAQKGTTLMLPANTGDPASMVRTFSAPENHGDKLSYPHRFLGGTGNGHLQETGAAQRSGRAGGSRVKCSNQ
jgi:hypothetical protein